MARPNILTFKAIPSGGMLQMISNTEFTALADKILEKFAVSDGPGNLFANTAGANANYTSIGTIDDTRTEAVGSTDTSITTSTTTLYQDLTSNYGTFSDRPFTWDNSSTSLRKISNTEMHALADDIVAHMVDNDAPGAYRIDTSSPAGTYGGTWAIIHTFTDQIDPTNGTTYSLYEKIANDTTMTQRPLKQQSQGTLQLMSNTEIDTISEIVRERIVTTEIGTYQFQASVPATGTWTNVGSVVDTRRDVVGVPTGFTGPATYVGPFDYVGPITYTGTAAFYGTDTYYGPATYIGGTVSFAPTAYYGFTPTSSTGPVPYYGPATYYGPISYIGPTPATFYGPANYYGVASYAGVYPWAGSQYFYGGYFYAGYFGGWARGYYSSQYLGTVYFYGPVGYIGPATFTGTAAYYGVQEVVFTGTTAYYGMAAYTGFVTYYGTAPATYYGPGTYYGSAAYYGAAGFAGPGTFYGPQGFTNVANYTGVANYIGSASYTGSVPTVDSGTSTISTITLWRRIG